MNRRAFLGLLGAVGALPALPFSALALPREPMPLVQAGARSGPVRKGLAGIGDFLLLSGSEVMLNLGNRLDLRPLSWDRIVVDFSGARPVVNVDTQSREYLLCRDRARSADGNGCGRYGYGFGYELYLAKGQAPVIMISGARDGTDLSSGAARVFF